RSFLAIRPDALTNSRYIVLLWAHAIYLDVAINRKRTTMTEKWLIAPGEERVIDIASATRLKVGLVGGQVDVIAHDEPGIRIEVHGVTIKDLRVESDGTQVEIDHPQIGWDNFLEVFRNFGAGGPKAEISIAVPRGIALTLGVVSAGALVSGIRNDAKLNTVSGDVI